MYTLCSLSARPSGEGEMLEEEADVWVCVDLYLRRPREEITGEWPLIHCVMIGVEATGTNVKWVISWFVGVGEGHCRPLKGRAPSAVHKKRTCPVVAFR